MLVLLLRTFGPLVLALAAAVLLDTLSARKGLLPPGFHLPFRRAAAFVLVTLFFWLGIFFPLGSFGTAAAAAPAELSRPELFLLHALMALTMGLWFLLGFAGRRAAPAAAVPALEPVPAAGSAQEGGSSEETGGSPAGEPALSMAESAPLAAVAVAPASPAAPPAPSLGRQFLAQFGYATPNPLGEVGLGVVFGIGAWMAVIVAIIAVALALVAVGAEKALPQAPPALVSLIVSLPFVLRLLLSLSAGLFEESFFRGFLQPRIGILLSTVLFVLPHLSYGQPFLLVGVTVLSLLYGRLVRWRQNIWPAIAAHALFDGVQLLVIAPAVLRLVPKAH